MSPWDPSSDLVTPPIQESLHGGLEHVTLHPDRFSHDTWGALDSLGHNFQIIDPGVQLEKDCALHFTLALELK